MAEVDCDSKSTQVREGSAREWLQAFQHTNNEKPKECRDGFDPVCVPFEDLLLL